MSYVLTVAMQKGGVAKTTTALTLAQAAQSRGQQVLCLDLDPQGNLTFALGANAKAPGCYEVLEGTAKIGKTIQGCNGIDVIPASLQLVTEKTTKGSGNRLRKALADIVGYYDLIIIDTPTLAGELLYNALLASNGLLIPTQADIYNLQSIYQLNDIAKAMQATSPYLQILGYVITRADKRSTIAKQMQENLKKTGLDCLGVISNGIAVQEAAALQANLYEYAPKCKPAAEYMALYERITKEAKKYAEETATGK